MSLFHTEIIKKGTVLMNIAMYVIRDMEQAIQNCESDCTTDDCTPYGVNGLDEAVALYTGALEGIDGTLTGNLMYDLADLRCRDFKTCGANGDAVTGTSKVNSDIFGLFDQMQDDIWGTSSDKCQSARAKKEKIVHLMFVPLIQGTLQSAFITEQAVYAENSDATGAAYAAAVLPMVAACNETDAGMIYANMRVGENGSTSFSEVRAAFERQYKCLGITCADVGGLWNPVAGVYEDGAAPCGTNSESSSSASSGSKNAGLAWGFTIAALALVTWIALVVRRRRTASPTADLKGNSSAPVV
jgi:hypothetical protein